MSLTNAANQPLTDLTVDISVFDSEGNLVATRQEDQDPGQTEPVEPVLPTNSKVPTQSLISSMPTSWKESSPTNFVIAPETPTSLSQLGVGGQQVLNWTLVPDAMGITDPDGEAFYVQATINYSIDGVPADPIETTREIITVHPQPKIPLYNVFWWLC